MRRNDMFGKLLIVSVLVLGSMLMACSKEEVPAQAIALMPGTVCALDGMTLMNYPGPKAQIHHVDGEVLYFCDTVEMFAIMLRPEQQKLVRSVFTQDMAKADWRTPRGHWIDATTAYYVHGSRRHGSMGPTFAAFAKKVDAEAFAKKHGGKVLHYKDVDINMADLRGGAKHKRDY